MSHVCHHNHHSHLDRNLFFSIILNAVIVVAEIVGGILSSSLALLSDAMHNFSDVTALTIAWLARRIGRRLPSNRHTYGFGRLEVLAALVNSGTLLIVLTLILREAILRFVDPEPVTASIMLPVAVIGLLANLFSMLLLRHHSHGDLNMRSAFIHLLQDTLSSVVVVVAALLARFPFGQYIDPAASLIVALFVIKSGWGILRESLHILMEGTPRDVDLMLLQDEIKKMFAVDDIHHLHIWQMMPGETLLTAHIKMKDMNLAQAEDIICKIRAYLQDRWNIGHATLEIETRICETPDLLDESHSNHH